MIVMKPSPFIGQGKMSCLSPVYPVTSPFHETLITTLRLRCPTIRLRLKGSLLARATCLADVHAWVADGALDAQYAEQSMEKMVVTQRLVGPAGQAAVFKPGD
ncbi:MAG: hypothetical protein ABR558_09425, partial [Thioalkalivibrio sp.]